MKTILLLSSLLAIPAELRDTRPEVSVNLMTDAGASVVNAQWRYSDTKIIETSFPGPGPDGQPTGGLRKTYDFAPHAGGLDFDDTAWERIAPSSLDQRRS